MNDSDRPFRRSTDDEPQRKSSAIGFMQTLGLDHGVKAIAFRIANFAVGFAAGYVGAGALMPADLETVLPATGAVTVAMVGVSTRVEDKVFSSEGVVPENLIGNTAFAGAGLAVGMIARELIKPYGGISKSVFGL